jgi:hypothetical protein
MQPLPLWGGIEFSDGDLGWISSSRGSPDRQAQVAKIGCNKGFAGHFVITLASGGTCRLPGNKRARRLLAQYVPRYDALHFAELKQGLIEMRQFSLGRSTHCIQLIGWRTPLKLSLCLTSR